MVEQEQWAAEGVQPQLNRSYYIRYNFNAGCSAGSAPFFVIRRITPYLLTGKLPYIWSYTVYIYGSGLP